MDTETRHGSSPLDEPKLNPDKIIKGLGLPAKISRQLHQSLEGMKKAEKLAELRRLYPEAFAQKSNFSESGENS